MLTKGHVFVYNEVKVFLMSKRSPFRYWGVKRREPNTFNLWEKTSYDIVMEDGFLGVIDEEIPDGEEKCR